MKLRKTRILKVTKYGYTEYWPQYKSFFWWVNFATFEFPVPIGDLHKELYEIMEDKTKSALEFNKPLDTLNSAKHVIDLYTDFVNRKNAELKGNEIMNKKIINYPNIRD